MSEYIDDEGVSHENYQSYVGSLLGLCGCRSDVIVDDLLAILDTYLNGEFTYYTALPVEGPDEYRELLLHMLNHADLIEHGTAIRGSWLTDRGKDVAQKLRDEKAQTVAHP